MPEANATDVRYLFDWVCQCSPWRVLIKDNNMFQCNCILTIGKYRHNTKVLNDLRESAVEILHRLMF